MKLFSLVFFVGLLSVQGFPAGEIGASHGITVEVFINTMLSSFNAVKGKDDCEGVVSAFQSVLEAWKGKEAFITDGFLAAFKTALAVKKMKHILLFHHVIDAFKTVLEVGAVKKILISEGFLLAFKGALEAKKAVVSEVFLKAFETALWPGGKFLGSPIDGLKSTISLDVFVKTMVSAFGEKDGVVTESFIKTITVTFGKCKGVHAGFIPAWKKAFDICRGTKETVSVAAFTLALKKESGLSFIPSDCLKALKSPENAKIFPEGVHEKILSALFDINGTKSDVAQAKPISSEELKSSISLDVFVKTMVSAFGAKDGVVTESFIKTITVTFGKCKGVHAGFIPAWKKAFDTCRGTQDTVSVAAFTLALKKESGLSFIPSDCLKALKSPENAKVFPEGIHEKILSALFDKDDINADGPLSTPNSGTPGDNINESEEFPTILDPTPASSPGNSDGAIDGSDASTPDKSGSTTVPDSDGPSSDSNSVAPPAIDAPVPTNTDSTTTPDSDTIPSKTATEPGSDATKPNSEPVSPILESLGTDKPATKKSGSTASAKASSAANAASGGVSKASSVAKSSASTNGSKTSAAAESKSKATASGASSTAASAATSATAGSADSTAAAAASTTTTVTSPVDKNPIDSKPCDKESLIPTPAKLIDAKSSIIAAGAEKIASLIPGL